MDEKPRRHCMIVFAYYPIGESRVQREAEALLERGIEVDVIALEKEGEPKEDHYNGVSIYRVPMGRTKPEGIISQFFEYLLFGFHCFTKVTRLHLKKRYQTVQVHNLPDFLVFFAFVPRLMGSKLILDLHDLMPEFYASRFGTKNNIVIRLVRIQEKLACKFAHHVITVSEPWRRSLIGRGVPPDKVSVVMNLGDRKIFNLEAIKNVKKEEGFVLIYHGTLVERYGVDFAIRAVAELKDELPDLRIIIIGSGGMIDKFTQLAEELGISDRVYFSRKVYHVEDLPRILASADVGTVTYRQDIFTDGILPTKLMEYAALGMPAIVSRMTTISEYFDDSMVEFFTPGNLSECADCIRRLYYDKDRRKQLSENVLKFNRNYNWDQLKEAYCDLIEGLGS